MIILILNLGKIPAALIEIVQGAFGLRAFGGGMFGAMIVAMQKGIARGIFSNEAGLGSAPIAAAAAQCGCIYIDGMSGVLCFYNNSRLGLLF